MPCHIDKTDRPGCRTKNKEKMKITNDYLIAQGFTEHNMSGKFWMKYDQPMTYNIRIRETVEGEGHQVSILKIKTKVYGKLDINVTNDDNTRYFVGHVVDVEELEAIIKACGIEMKEQKPAKVSKWRKKYPYFLVRSKQFKVFVMYENEALFTGFETDDYNEAMAEINCRNKEHNRKK